MAPGCADAPPPESVLRTKNHDGQILSMPPPVLGHLFVSSTFSPNFPFLNLKPNLIFPFHSPLLVEPGTCDPNHNAPRSVFPAVFGRHVFVGGALLAPWFVLFTTQFPRRASARRCPPWPPFDSLADPPFPVLNRLASFSLGPPSASAPGAFWAPPVLREIRSRSPSAWPPPLTAFCWASLAGRLAISILTLHGRSLRHD